MPKKRSYICYLHLRPNGEVFYVGMSRFLHRASDTHNRNRSWHQVVRQEGGFNVRIVFRTTDRKAAIQKEIELIAKFGRRDRKAGTLVNRTDGGIGGRGILFSPQRRRIMASRFLGVRLTPSQVRAREVTLSAALGLKVLDTATGRTFPSVSEAARFHGLRQGNLIRWLKGERGNPTSLRLLDAAEDKSFPAAPLEKAVVDVVSGTVFKSCKDAAAAFGMSRSALCRQLKGQTRRRSSLYYLPDSKAQLSKQAA